MEELMSTPLELNLPIFLLTMELFTLFQSKSFHRFMTEKLITSTKKFKILISNLSVLNPNNDTAKPVPDADPPPPAFENANSVSTDPLTDGIPSPTSVIPLPGVTNGGEGGGGGGGGESTTPPSPTATVTETQSGGGGGGGGGAGGGPEPTATTTPQPGAAATERAKAGLAAAVGLGVVLINA